MATECGGGHSIHSVSIAVVVGAAGVGNDDTSDFDRLTHPSLPLNIGQPVHLRAVTNSASGSRRVFPEPKSAVAQVRLEFWDVF